MSKTLRLLDIWFYINNKTYFSAQELADEFGVSLRTIQRDLIELTLLGAPFYSKAGKNGGYFMQDSDLLPPLMFSFQEVLSILITYDTLDNYIDNPYLLETDSVKKKLISNLSDKNISDYHEVKDYITMWNYPHKNDSSYTKEILESAINRRWIKTIYNSSGNKQERILAPIGVYGQNGYWYFPAYDKNKDDIRLFRSDRVENIELLTMHQKELPTLKSWLSFENQFKESTELKVRLSKRAYQMFSRLLNIKETLSEDELFIYTGIIREKDYEYLALEIIKAKEEIEVIKPVELINVIKDNVREINEFIKRTY